MILFNNGPAGAIISKAVNSRYDPAVDWSLSKWVSGRLTFGVLFNHYTGSSIEMHITSALPGQTCRQGLFQTFDFPFNVLGVKKIIGKANSNNVKSITYQKKLGFKLEAVIKDVYPDGDMVIHTLVRERCWVLDLIKPVT